MGKERKHLFNIHLSKQEQPLSHIRSVITYLQEDGCSFSKAHSRAFGDVSNPSPTLLISRQSQEEIKFRVEFLCRINKRNPKFLGQLCREGL